MRLRHTAVAAIGALALTLTLSTSAYAAVGDFVYSYTGPDGSIQTSRLVDPASQVCHTLPEAADEDTSTPAHSPSNLTNATVTVFTGAECDGESFTLQPGAQASERLKLRSAFFS
ncbi:hypothetical protein [Streptomyces sp. MS2.AVA.5]|uniref:Uncharacterized protein n=1 Tax=Streptomyces achmelvichensis TaxID=3134111 RepID=A0ACC6Q7T7_9ACTN